MINKLRERNEKLIALSGDNSEKLKMQNYIKQVLKDDKCFFKIDFDTAFNILLNLKISKSDAKEVYRQLIDSKNYK